MNIIAQVAIGQKSAKDKLKENLNNQMRLWMMH